jgi:HTH domain
MRNVLGGVVGEGRKPHKTRSHRKVITIQEWADYLGVSRQTVTAYLKAYQKLNTYDPHDIYSVLNFEKFLLTSNKFRLSPIP